MAIAERLYTWRGTNQPDSVLPGRIHDILTIAVAILVLYPLVTCLSSRYRPHLRKIPGPFWDSLSNIPRVLKLVSGRSCFHDIALHKEYGPVVRVGPNKVSFSDGAALSQVYGTTTRFEKSDFYVPFDAKSPFGLVPTVFSVRSERFHRNMRKPFTVAYGMQQLLALEPLTDNCIEIFERKIDERLQASGDGTTVMDFTDWLHWYAMDVILSVTFSNCLDFMEQEQDVLGLIAAIEGRLKYNSTVGQVPFLHKYLLGNDTVGKVASIIPAVAQWNTSRYIVDFVKKQIDRYYTATGKDTKYFDILERFRQTDDNGEAQMNDKDLLASGAGTIFAGSDTTAISLRAMFYYLIKNPRCFAKLREEIDAADRDNQLSKAITFSESITHLPYMQACLKEAMRLHPGVGLLLERIVPKQGVEIAGTFIPPGTIIGANPWVVARDQEVYGADADSYRPERWLEAYQADKDGEPQMLRLMERNFLAFGAGSRNCVGKNIALLEMNKLIPQFVRKYDIELVNPDLEVEVEDYWFAKQLGLVCRISLRVSS